MASNAWLKGDLLHGRRVFVPRPGAQAQGLIKAIQTAGGEAIRCPVLRIEPTAITARAKQQIIHLDQYDVLIFISRNAVQLGLDRIADDWPRLPSHLRCFAVGKRTAACLEDEGVGAIVPSAGFNSEALLQLPALQQLTDQRVLIFKGDGGRELLAQCLLERGAQVESLILYRREVIHYCADELQTLFTSGLPEALIATSVEVLTAMNELLQPELDDCFELPLVVASERIAQAAKELGYQQIISAHSAADESIVAALNSIG